MFLSISRMSKLSIFALTLVCLLLSLSFKLLQSFLINFLKIFFLLSQIDFVLVPLILDLLFKFWAFIPVIFKLSFIENSHLIIFNHRIKLLSHFSYLLGLVFHDLSLFLFNVCHLLAMLVIDFIGILFIHFFNLFDLGVKLYFFSRFFLDFLFQFLDDIFFVLSWLFICLVKLVQISMQLFNLSFLIVKQLV